MPWRACDLVDRPASPTRAGLVFVDEYGHRRDYTFAEIAQHAARYAAVMLAFGVREGDSAFVCLSATAKCIFTLLALERIGASAVLDEDGAAGANTIVAGRKFRARIDAERDRYAADARYLLIGEECEGWARLDTLAHTAASAAPAQPPGESDEAELERAREEAFDTLGAVSTDVVWFATGLAYADWYRRAVVQPWLLGCTAVVHDRGFDAQERLDLVRELDVTILIQRGAEYGAQLELPDPKRFKLPRLRRCLALDEAGGEAVKAQWAQRFGVAISSYAAASRSA